MNHFSEFVIEAFNTLHVSDDQQRALLARFNYVLELCDKLETADAPMPPALLLDEFELDAWVNLGAPEDGDEREISSWLIHTSWSSECDNFDPLGLLDSRLAERLERLPSDESAMGLHEWLVAMAFPLRLAAKGAIQASDICAFVANVIAANVLLFDLLAKLTRARLLSRRA